VNSVFLTFFNSYLFLSIFPELKRIQKIEWKTFHGNSLAIGYFDRQNIGIRSHDSGITLLCYDIKLFFWIPECLTYKSFKSLIYYLCHKLTTLSYPNLTSVSGVARAPLEHLANSDWYDFSQESPSMYAGTWRSSKSVRQFAPGNFCHHFFLLDITGKL